MLINDFNERFYELKAMEFPSWLTQPLLVDLSAVSEQRQQEVCELHQDEAWKLFSGLKEPCHVSVRNVKRNTLARVAYFGKAKTDKFSVFFFGRMWGYSVVADLLRANRNQLEITKRSDGD